MNRTRVIYEPGTGAALETIEDVQSWVGVDDGYDFRHPIPERRVPARMRTTWIPRHRIVRVETDEDV